MNLYKISQDVNDGYDTYSDAVVVAANEDEAKMIHPNGDVSWAENPDADPDDDNSYDWIDKHGFTGSYSWTSPDNVKAELVGTATPNLVAGVVICASFHAG